MKLTVAATLLFGALAGVSAEVFTYPLEVIRRKMQLERTLASRHASSLPPEARAAVRRAVRTCKGARNVSPAVPKHSHMPLQRSRIVTLCMCFVRVRRVPECSAIGVAQGWKKLDQSDKCYLLADAGALQHAHPARRAHEHALARRARPVRRHGAQRAAGAAELRTGLLHVRGDEGHSGRARLKP
jgi:Mitochondrial carrier protein